MFVATWPPSKAVSVRVEWCVAEHHSARLACIFSPCLHGVKSISELLLDVVNSSPWMSREMARLGGLARAKSMSPEDGRECCESRESCCPCANRKSESRRNTKKAANELGDFRSEYPQGLSVTAFSRTSRISASRAVPILEPHVNADQILFDNMREIQSTSRVDPRSGPFFGGKLNSSMLLGNGVAAVRLHALELI